ncbi:2,3,4,5-tetrahydropyridine-2,6-dicarboxylate N-acetyltransferase [Stappia sp. 22II-S9-Z10]|nr:2,3,4,5-tetrahydropyridine-2,6-dicarboxylate N-acetyltransferase [Stappia sp. 22II-S9-Z10]
MWPGAFVHPKSHVDGSVALGEGTHIWQFASVTRGAVLGRGCSVSPFAMLDGSIYGDRVVIGAGVACGPGFLVGNDVHICPHVLLSNDVWPFASKEGFSYEALRSGDRFAVVVEDGAFIGAGAKVMAGVRIGRGAGVEANAKVYRDVPAGMLARASGELTPIPDDWAARRMRFVRESAPC